MKRAAYYSALFLILISCEQTYYSVPVTNNSSKTVCFSYDGSIDNLDPSKSKLYSVVAHTLPPVLLGVVPEGVRNVDVKRDNDGYKFVDLPAISLHVMNTLPVEITVKADDFIDDSNNQTFLTVSENTEIINAKIYAKNPIFTVTASGYSAQVTYTITDDVMYVVIR